MLAGAVALAASGAASAQALGDKKANDLMGKGGCSACHDIDKKGVGTSYKDVAAKKQGEEERGAGGVR